MQKHAERKPNRNRVRKTAEKFIVSRRRSVFSCVRVGREIAVNARERNTTRLARESSRESHYSSARWLRGSARRGAPAAAYFVQ